MAMRQLAMITAVFLAACSVADEDLTEAPEPLGQFRLGHNIAIADNTQKGPYSQDFTQDQLEAAVQNAVAERLRRYDGDGLYHLGVVVGAVALTQPGIPVVYASQSAMIVDVTVFDNATQEKLNTEPHRIFATLGMGGGVPLIGTGYVGEPEQQMQRLSKVVAKEIEEWLRDNPQWFAPRDGQVRVPYDISVPAPVIDTSSIENISTGEEVAN